MRVVAEYPPLMDEIDLVFNVRGKKVLYAWAPDIIYNPCGSDIPKELEAHESVHLQRQGTTPTEWWRKYLDDMEFRLAEELAAHQVEYGTFCNIHRDRNARALALHRIAARLSSPFYGSIISFKDARERIR